MPRLAGLDHRRTLATGCAVVALAAATGAIASPAGVSTATATGARYGVAEDASKFASDGGASVYRDLEAVGMTLNRWTAIWDPAVPEKEIPFLDRALDAKPAGIEIVLSVYPDPATLAVGPDGLRIPPDPDAFCGWAGGLAERYRGRIDRFIVLNEPNLATFWPKTNRAATVEATLAACYDTIKTANPAARVAGLGLSARAPSSASTAPIDLIAAVGSAYRASGRKAPLFDAIAVHPYPPQDRSIDPTPGPDSPAAGYLGSPAFYGISTLQRVKDAVETAFAGTAQPTVATGLKLMVDEYGYQVNMTGDPRYTGTESSSTVPDAATQAAYYATAITGTLACDPDISDVLFFHLADERDLGSGDGGGGWQSGLEEVDGTRRASFDAVRDAIRLGCTNAPARLVAGPPPPRPRHVCTMSGSPTGDTLAPRVLFPTVICGRTGGDTLVSGPAGGVVVGGPGADRIVAGGARTVVDAGPGADRIDACNRRAEPIDGGQGFDVATIDRGRDTVTGVEVVLDCRGGSRR